MNNLIYFIIFLIITIYILFKAIGYAIYEIKECDNKYGGIVIISLSVFTVIFVNIMMLIR